MENVLKCPNCDAVVEAEQKFCKKCGTKIESNVPVPPTHCPNPNCGRTLEGYEKFCPACGTIITSEKSTNQSERVTDSPKESEADIELPQDTTQLYKQIFDVAKSHLQNNPDDEHAYDAMIIQEIAKTVIAINAMSRNEKIDFSLRKWDVEIPGVLINKLLEEDRQKIVEIPNKVFPMYIGKSLDTPEFNRFLSKVFPGRTIDISYLERKRDRFSGMIYSGMESCIDGVLTEAVKKHQAMLINGKARVSFENIPAKQLDSEAKTYYKYLTENRLEESRDGFEKHVNLNPYIAYTHNILHVIHDKLGNYDQAFSEILFATWIEAQDAKNDHSKKRDIFYVENLVNMIRQLGLTPFLQIYLENFQEEFGEILEEGNIDEKRSFFRIGAYGNIGAFVKNAISNTYSLMSLQEK